MPTNLRKLTHPELVSRRLSADEIHHAPRYPVYALLDNIRSMYNVGSIFRTSDGARIAGLLLTGFTPHPPRKEISKTALGATETVPWSYYRDPKEAVSFLSGEGIRLCVVEHTDRSIPYTEVQPHHFPLCLIIGNELSGVSPVFLEAADMAIEIPMFGTKQSLNVAVAYGIAAFEMVRIAGSPSELSSRVGGTSTSGAST
jgi:tRNA G18 (ribose-2'-O)-methylase SpoU